MKEKILKKAIDLFINFGFKSVTMDDIASEMHISKKTIYSHFNNKTKLVEAATFCVFETISNEINCICELQKNPIEELYEIKKSVMLHLKNEKTSPHYQLCKYYPEINESLKKKQFELMQELFKENLTKGIEQKLYRKDIDIDFTARIYFNGMLGIKNKDLFPLVNYSMNTLTSYHLEYHLRGISTAKGIKELEKQL